jgi:hypothetical protein
MEDSQPPMRLFLNSLPHVDMVLAWLPAIHSCRFLSLIPFCVAASIVFQSADGSTDEWKWQRIAWDDMKVWSASSPPDSGNTVYVSICDGTDRGVHKSTDGGFTWRFLPESTAYFADMLTINPAFQAEIYCGTWSESESPGTGPRRSRDAGQHWEELVGSFNKIVPSPSTEGLLLGVHTHYYRYGLSRSTDDGLTWDLIAASSFYHISSDVVFHAEHPNEVYAGWYDDAVGWGLGKSTDNGETWDVVVPGELAGFDQNPEDSDHWVAVMLPDGTGDPGTLAVTYDNWATFETWGLPDTLVWLEQVLFDSHDPNTLYLLDNWSTGQAGNGSRIDRFGVLRSTDTGHTWHLLNEGFIDPRFVFRLVPVHGSPGGLLAIAFDGLWKYTNEVSIGEEMDARPVALRLERIGPNPFREQIRFNLAIGRGERVEARVYDLDGRLIRTLFNSALDEGVFEFRWSGRNGYSIPVPSGTYILELQSRSNHIERRIVKLR